MPEIADHEIQAARSCDAWIESAPARLPRWMAAAAVVSILTALVTAHPRFASGFAVGSTVSILAYRWLHRAVSAALDSTAPRPARVLMLKFAMRYPLLILVVVLCFQTGWLPLRGVIAGLFVPAAGVLIECVVLAARILHRLPLSAHMAGSKVRPDLT